MELPVPCNPWGRILPKGSTAYDALLGGGGDSQGVALAFSLLCRQVGITCSVVDGQKNGQSHFWNVVQTASGYRHVDLSRTGNVAYNVDQTMTRAGGMSGMPSRSLPAIDSALKIILKILKSG
ncbi:MAG: transglutaminase domain-containing protein [Oscillospiraceae bacterium]